MATLIDTLLVLSEVARRAFLSSCSLVPSHTLSSSLEETFLPGLQMASNREGRVNVLLVQRDLNRLEDPKLTQLNRGTCKGQCLGGSNAQAGAAQPCWVCPGVLGASSAP